MGKLVIENYGEWLNEAKRRKKKASSGNFMSKSEINKALKALDFGLVKMKINMYKSKTHPSRQQGIRGGSIGPMTATDAHLNHNREALDKVKDKLESIGGRIEETHADLTVTFPSKKGELVYNFLWSLYPTYAGNDYDPSYQTYWLTYTVTEREPVVEAIMNEVNEKDQWVIKNDKGQYLNHWYNTWTNKINKFVKYDSEDWANRAAAKHGGTVKKLK